MSDEERDFSEEEEVEEEEEEEQEESEEEAATEETSEPEAPAKKESAPVDSGPSEAELAMQKRRQQQMSSTGLDEAAIELLEQNRAEREEMEAEIREMRERSARRKKEVEEQKRRDTRVEKMAEFEKWKNPTNQPNFVIQKRDPTLDNKGDDEEEDENQENKKSKEQLEAEKKAIMAQRIQPLAIEGLDEDKLKEKAKEIHKLIFRLEGEKYDLEKRYKDQQFDMMELAERARNMNKVGKGGLKRVMLCVDERDEFQERFAGAPAKIEMYSTFEMQKDKRAYGTRRGLFTGPQYGYPADKISPYRHVKWNEQGLLEYQQMEGCQPPVEDEGEEVEEAAEE